MTAKWMEKDMKGSPLAGVRLSLMATRRLGLVICKCRNRLIMDLRREKRLADGFASLFRDLHVRTPVSRSVTGS